MKVYAVIEGYDYEGENFNTLRLFPTEVSAREYAGTLKVWHHAYTLMEEFDLPGCEFTNKPE